jgi:acyl-CoA synthetase (AMP-forming)/AMP-acid ligase II
VVDGFEKVTLSDYRWSTFKEVKQRVTNVASGFVDLTGIKSGDKVVIYADTKMAGSRLHRHRPHDCARVWFCARGVRPVGPSQSARPSQPCREIYGRSIASSPTAPSNPKHGDCVLSVPSTSQHTATHQPTKCACGRRVNPPWSYTKEWQLAAQAAFSQGCSVVTIYATLGPEGVEHGEGTIHYHVTRGSKVEAPFPLIVTCVVCVCVRGFVFPCALFLFCFSRRCILPSVL